MRSGASGIKRTHGPEGVPFSTGRLWRGIWRGVSRLSPRLVSAMWSAVSFVTVTVFVLGVSIGLIAVVVVSFCFLSLRLALGLLAVAVVPLRQFLVSPFGVGFSYVRWFRVCVLLFVCVIRRPIL